MSKGKWPHEASDQDPGNAPGDLIGEIHMPDELSQSGHYHLPPKQLVDLTVRQ